MALGLGYKKSISSALALMASSLLVSGCNDTIKIECQNLISALMAVQPMHVSVMQRFNAEAFKSAQLTLLSQRQVKVSSSKAPATPLDQCEGTLGLLQKHYPKTNLREFSLELMTAYARHWDPHSAALSDQSLSNQSSFLTGFGFTVERADDTGRVEVVDVIAGSPAHNAGLQEGMFIWTINKRFVREISTTELVSLINDRASNRLVIGVLGGPSHSYHELTIKRGTFEASPVKLNAYRLLSGTTERTIGYLKIRNFVGAQAFFAEALKTLRYADALMVDLRNIAGGDVQAAADVADHLLSDSDSFVGMLSRGGKLSEIVRMKSLSKTFDGPIVVLANDTTKSAAEILAGALQDHGAIVVGTPTFGKGTRQRLQPLSQYKLSGAMLITDAFTVRPSGKVIQFRGVAPDVRLPLRSKAKSEAHYPKALMPPADLPPLPGYDPTAYPTRSKTFRAKLAELEKQIQSYVEAGLSASSQEDLHLEAAKRVALFMAGHAEFSAPANPAQEKLKFE